LIAYHLISDSACVCCLSLDIGINSAVSAPANDRCVDATLLEPDIAVLGDNSDANFDYVNQAVCGPRSDRRGVWFKIVGTGLKTTVDVCTNSEKVTDFGIFSACNNNDASVCVGFPPQTDAVKMCENNETAAFSWDAEDGTNYWVNVRSEWDAVTFGTSFTVVYTEEGGEPPAPGPSPGPAPSAAMSVSSFLAIVVSGLVMAWL
jgi:hypothetical protein